MKVLVIGCGGIGGAITKNLVDLPFIKEISLYSKYQKDSKKLQSKIKSHKIKIIKSLSVNNYDYIILSLSAIPNNKRKKSFSDYKTTHEIRTEELRYNLPEIIKLSKYLKKVPSSTKVIIITNPVDEITNYLISKLKKHNIYGYGTELDVSRYTKLLNKKVSCIGYHGMAVPLVNLKQNDFEKLNAQIDKKIIKSLRKNGINHELMGKSFRGFLEKAHSKKEQIVHLSRYLQKSFLGVKNLAISIPYKVKNGKFIGPAKIKVNKIELQKFKEVAIELKTVVNQLIKDYPI